MPEPVNADEVGFISVDAWAEKSFVVPIAHFDYDHLDSAEDQVRERIKAGQAIAPLIQEWAKALAEHEQAETVRAIIELVQDTDNPKRRLDEIMLACGISLSGKRETLLSVARRYGVKKQAVHRCVKQVLVALGLRKTRTMRSDEARRAMSEAYWERKK